MKNSTIISYNTVVDINFKGSDGTKLNGIETYKTITEALSKAPKSSKTEYIIFIKSGRYNEKITVDKPNITLIGQNMSKTKITFAAANSMLKPDGTTYGTFGSASVSVIAENFKAENLTFENAFDYLKNKSKPDNDQTKLANPQAVALSFDNGCNRAYIKDCIITGYQDTLYANSGTLYFTNCYIAGCIDFIFGAGQAFFNKCDIVSLDMGSNTNNGYITAASTNILNKYGFVFYKCTIKKGHNKITDHTVSLGRPWHPTTSFPNGTREADPNAVGSVIYMNCTMFSHITINGWEKMQGRDKKGDLIWFMPETSRFYEYENKGPGVAQNPSRKQLSKKEAKNCTEKNVLCGWEPK
ncbi:pectinesterase family protein [Clostridium akagii]|uniref:pectinesterase family protein n=1 Tax=Clostridium akagii TaxID=91623 RepID=UPI00068E84A9|nr:pectinesterase family protein [Clostridium akagii]